MALAVDDPEEIERWRRYHAVHGYPPEVLAVSEHILAAIDKALEDSND